MQCLVAGNALVHTVAVESSLPPLLFASCRSPLLQAKGIEAVPLAGNLVDAVWGAERPGLPDSPLRVHELQWAGRSVADKLTEVCRSVVVCVRW